jgi:hypothetical protein
MQVACHKGQGPANYGSFTTRPGPRPRLSTTYLLVSIFTFVYIFITFVNTFRTFCAKVRKPKGLSPQPAYLHPVISSRFPLFDSAPAKGYIGTDARRHCAKFLSAQKNLLELSNSGMEARERTKIRSGTRKNLTFLITVRGELGHNGKVKPGCTII